MAEIRAFRGIRPVVEKVKDVAAPPYDVLNSEEAREKVKGNPLSFLHVSKPEVDLPRDVHIYDEKVYEKGKENLDNLIQQGILVQDEKPNLYIYKQVMGCHAQTGLVVCCSVDDYVNDIIKKHEHTRADKEADRIKHVDVLDANTGPVFLTYKALSNVNELIENYTVEKPLYDFISDDDVRHILWKIDDSALINSLIDIFGDVTTLYVADGHHRSASAAKVGLKRREANPAHKGDEEYNYFLAVLFPHDQLKIMDYNRVVKDLNGMTAQEFLKKVSEKFDVIIYSSKEPFQPAKKHEMGMYIEKLWYKLSPKIGSFPIDDPVNSLDVAILQKNLLEPVLGIGDPRKDERIDFVGGIRGLSELEKRVNAGEAVAFSMYPTSVEELMSIADAGEIMPPKSTWFEPKLKSGIIIHKLS